MIYFIGCGPGDFELVTLKARRIISEADVILYAGTSVPLWLLTYAKQGCQLFSSVELTFREQIEIMEVNAGKNICRLHQGCVGVFSTMKEYIDILDAKDIEYECVPGISVVDYICAKLHLETCLQGVSQGVIICRSDSVNSYLPKRKNQDIKAFAVHQTSMIVFMAEHELQYTVGQLLKGGFKGNTPCILFGNAACPDEWVKKFTLNELRKNVVVPQGMFVLLVGDFISAVNRDLVNYSNKELILPKLF